MFQDFQKRGEPSEVFREISKMSHQENLEFVFIINCLQFLFHNNLGEHGP